MSHYIPRIVGNICWFYSITSQWSPIEATLNHHHHRQNHMHIPWNHHQIPTTFQQKTSHSTFITPGVMALLRSGRCQNHTTLLSRKDGDKTSSFFGVYPIFSGKALKKSRKWDKQSSLATVFNLLGRNFHLYHLSLRQRLHHRLASGL